MAVYKTTRLIIRNDKVQQAFDFLQQMIWSKSKAESAPLFAELGAINIDLRIVCENDGADLRVKILAENHATVKDGIIGKGASQFWKSFHQQLDDVITVPLALQPCII